MRTPGVHPDLFADADDRAREPSFDERGANAAAITAEPKHRKRQQKSLCNATAGTQDTGTKQHGERYLTDNAVAKRFSVSRPTIWRWTKSVPDFPKPIQLSSGTTRWRLSDLIEFDARVAVRFRAGSDQ